MAEPGSQQRFTANLQGEVDSAALYKTLSETEKNPQLAQVYGRLAAVESAHAEFWKRQIAALGQRVPQLHPGFRTRALEWLARRFGPAFVLPTVNTLEQIDSGSYSSQPEAVAGGLPAAERSHARIIGALAGPSGNAFSGATLARLEGRHRGMGGNALRAAVLGANDGLVSNLSLVMGVAGADMAAHAILVTGLAGLLAGSCSMALGEWLSVNTARESAQRQIDTEADELEQVPEEEEEELALIYQAKGLPEALGQDFGKAADLQQKDGARHFGPRGVGDRSRRTRRFGLGCRWYLFPAFCGGGDLPGSTVFHARRHSGVNSQPCGEWRCAVSDRGRDIAVHRTQCVVLGSAPAARRSRRRRRYLRHRPADRRCRDRIIRPLR